MKWKKLFKASSHASQSPKSKNKSNSKNNSNPNHTYQFPQHEKLEEHNEKYFQKVTSRNKIIIANAKESSGNAAPKKATAGMQQPKESPPGVVAQGIRSRNALLDKAAHEHAVIAAPPTPTTLLDKTGSSVRVNKMIVLPKPRDSTPIHQLHRRVDTKPLIVSQGEEDGAQRSQQNSREQVAQEYPFCSKVTCCSLSEQYLAVGCENGSISIYARRGEAKEYSILHQIFKSMKIRAVQFSPSNRYLAAGGDDCVASLYTVSSNEYTVANEIQRDDRVYTLSFSQTERQMAVGGFDGFVAIALVPSMQIIKEISRLGLILSIDYSFGFGRYLAIGGSDKCAAIVATSEKEGGEESWDVLGEIYRLGSVQSLQWHPTSNILAMGGHDGLVTIVDIETRQIIKEILGTTSDPQSPNIKIPRRIQTVAWSKHGRYLATGGTDDICNIYDATDGLYVTKQQYKRDNHITCIAWNQHGIVIGGDDCIIAAYPNLLGGLTHGMQEETMLDQGDQGDPGDPGDGMSQVTHSSYISGPAGIRDVVTTTTYMSSSNPPPSNTAPLEQTNKHKIECVAFSPNSYYLAYILHHALHVLQVNTNWSQVTTTTNNTISSTRTINVIAWSQDSQYIAVGSLTGVLDIYTANDKFTIPIYTKQHFTPNTSITTMQYNITNNKLAIACDHGILQIVDVYLNYSITSEYHIYSSSERETNECIGITCMDWSKNGLYFTIGTSDGLVTIHETNHVYGNYFTNPIGTIQRTSAIIQLQFGVGGKFLAIGEVSGNVSIYKYKEVWISCHALEYPGGALNSIGWSYDDRFFAMGGFSSNAIMDSSMGGVVVDTISWEPIDEYIQNTSSTSSPSKKNTSVQSLSWSSNGQYLVFGSIHGCVLNVIHVTTWTILKYIHCLDIPADKNPEEMPTNRYSYPIEEKGEDLMNHVAPIPVDVSTNPHEEILPYHTKNTSPNANCAKATMMINNTSNPYIPWNDCPEPIHFLHTANTFLEPYNNYDTTPPSILRSYISSIFMLECHVQYITDKQSTYPQQVHSLLESNKSEPWTLFLQMLRITTEVMEEVMESDYIVDTWWGMIRKFDLNDYEFSLLDMWNTYWKQMNTSKDENEEDMLIDLELLASVDDLIDSGQQGEEENDNTEELDSSITLQSGEEEDAVDYFDTRDSTTTLLPYHDKDVIIRTQDHHNIDALYQMNDEDGDESENLSQEEEGEEEEGNCDIISGTSSSHVLALSSSQEQSSTTTPMPPPQDEEDSKSKNSLFDVGGSSSIEEDLFAHSSASNPFETVDAILNSSSNDDTADRSTHSDLFAFSTERLGVDTVNGTSDDTTQKYVEEEGEEYTNTDMDFDTIEYKDNAKSRSEEELFESVKPTVFPNAINQTVENNRFVFNHQPKNTITQVPATTPTLTVNPDAFSSATMSDSNEHLRYDNSFGVAVASSSSSHTPFNNHQKNQGVQDKQEYPAREPSPPHSTQEGMQVSSYESFKMTGIVHSMNSNDSSFQSRGLLSINDDGPYASTSLEEEMHDDVSHSTTSEEQRQQQQQDDPQTEYYAPNNNMSKKSQDKEDTVDNNSNTKHSNEISEQKHSELSEEENYLSRFGQHLKPVQQRNNHHLSYQYKYKNATIKNSMIPKRFLKKGQPSPESVSTDIPNANNVTSKDITTPEVEHVSPSYARSGRFEVTKTNKSPVLPSYPVYNHTTTTSSPKTNTTSPVVQQQKEDIPPPPPSSPPMDDNNTKPSLPVKNSYLRSGRFQVTSKRSTPTYFSPFAHTNPSPPQSQYKTLDKTSSSSPYNTSASQDKEDNDDDMDDTKQVDKANNPPLFRTGRFQVSKKSTTPTSFSSNHYISPQQSHHKTLDKTISSVNSIPTTISQQETEEETNSNDDDNDSKLVVEADNNKPTPSYRAGRFQVSKKSRPPSPFSSNHYISYNNKKQQNNIISTPSHNTPAATGNNSSSSPPSTETATTTPNQKVVPSFHTIKKLNYNSTNIKKQQITFTSTPSPNTAANGNNSSSFPPSIETATTAPSFQKIKKLNYSNINHINIPSSTNTSSSSAAGSPPGTTATDHAQQSQPILNNKPISNNNNIHPSYNLRRTTSTNKREGLTSPTNNVASSSSNSNTASPIQPQSQQPTTTTTPTMASPTPRIIKSKIKNNPFIESDLRKHYS